MGIRKDYMAYNGTEAPFHTIRSAAFSPDGGCTVQVSSHRTKHDAKIRTGQVFVREYTFAGVFPSENAFPQIYALLIQHPDFAGGEAF